MRRRRLFFWGGIGLLFVGGGIATLLVLLFHEPAFYSRAHVPPSKERTDVAMQLLAKLIELQDHFGKDDDNFGKKKPWNHTFSAEQINCYLEEDLGRGELAESLGRRGIS